MSQLRWDPTLREWVTYAPHRQDRTSLPPPEWCPLCPTKEGRFRTEVPCQTYQIAVFENRFSAYKLGAPSCDEQGSELSLTAPARGVCEVMAYSEEHHATLAQLEERRIRNVVDVWADRYQELGALDVVRYVFIFENKGEVVGVTLHHPHGQIYGYPFIPPRPAKELQTARRYRQTHSAQCLHCAILAQEQRDGCRIIFEGERFVAFVPRFAHFPYEVHIYAKRCTASVQELSAAERHDLAHVLKRTLTGYDALWGFSLPHIMVIHQAPTDGESYAGVAHFHIEFYPVHRTSEKLKYLCGGEIGAGAFIADMMPEAAAAQLRAAVECGGYHGGSRERGPSG